MNLQNYQQLIAEGLKELPESALAEITDFVYFVRLRTLGGSQSETDLYRYLLTLNTEELSLTSQQHIDEEFAEYEQLYPQA